MTTIDTICLPPQPRTSVTREKRNFFMSLIYWIVLCGQKRRGRLALSEMSPEQLLDIGITDREAWQEAARPFWN
ncbi:uncharacterized protein YjiS (DUF1127 family) [Pararhizobium capsulatum DSM 1112]|uniref:Uncharacterized protein YjiS (DUF1127 family) n=1 Tax=Pararhizobium capsulatum DSM 1112 TaxID=1121113 RepID=A0ABU0BQF4_9HYPH|nr:DUF1127 domain-containing protein [Pararhizobium capsulatum]MDQ0320479.1 uncharacterized protein YjiS (DUF1127 family) [Pararhizobium capsulatum DSM 1112]